MNEETNNQTKKPSAILIRLDAEAQFFMLTEREAGQVIRALLRYANTGEVLQIKSRSAKITFEQLKATVDSYNEMYVARCEKSKAAIEARWRKKKEAEEKANAIMQIQANTNVYDGIPTNTNEYERIPTYTNVYERILLNKSKDKDKLNENKDKDKLNTLSCENNAHAHTHEVSTDDFVQSLSGQESFIENCSMALHTTKERIADLLNQFGIECKAKKAIHVNERDFSAHFVDWARIQLEKETAKKKNPRRRTPDNDINEEWK